MSQTTQARLTRLQKSLIASRSDFPAVDAFLVSNETNVTWLSGFTGDSTWLYIDSESATLISDSRYTIQLSEESPEIPAMIRDNVQTMRDCLAEIISNRFTGSGKVRLGIESGTTSQEEYQHILEKFASQIESGKLVLVPTSSVVETLRQTKDKTEIELTRKAITFAQRGLDQILAGLRGDQTERDIAIELEYRMRTLGADDDSFPTIVAVGPRAALPHAVPGNTRVNESEFILIDWGASYRSYRSDMTRTIVTGKASAKYKKIYQIVKDAHDAAIEAIKPGVTCSEIDKIARDIITNAGYGPYFGHGLGHSVGMQIHENPRFSPNCTDVLKPGMIMTVEPGIYLKDWGGIRIEDDILVTSKGYEVMTDATPTDLDAMTVVRL